MASANQREEETDETMEIIRGRGLELQGIWGLTYCFGLQRLHTSGGLPRAAIVGDLCREREAVGYGGHPPLVLGNCGWGSLPLLLLVQVVAVLQAITSV